MALEVALVALLAMLAGKTAVLAQSVLSGVSVALVELPHSPQLMLALNFLGKS
jgi:hypothetical protein